MTQTQDALCKDTFEKWLAKKSLSASKDEDVWGQEIYRYPKIEAMWYSWKACWADHVETPDTSPAHVKNQAGIEQGDVEKLKHECFEKTDLSVSGIIDYLIRRGFRMQGDGWLPIETRPTTDNISFLVFVPKTKDMDSHCVVQVSPYEGRIYPDAKQFCIDWDDGIENATHWMPLPNSPQASGSGHAHPASMNQHDAPPDTVDGGE